jgi:hypothetical protein
MVLAKCFSWPNCHCGQNITNINLKIDDWIENPIPHEEILHVMLVLYSALRCTEAHSSRPTVRQSATLQLLHPVWNALPKELRR